MSEKAAEKIVSVSRDIESLLKEVDNLHMEGFNCAESVLWGLSKYWNLKISTSCATGLGGGVARSGSTCGAILGAIIALGVFVSRIDPKDQEGKLRCYDLGQELMKIFSKEMGSTFCKEIIGFVLASEGGIQKYAQGGFKQGKCRRAIITAIKAAITVTNG